MKKKIAVFAGGWGGEYLQEVLAGMQKSASKVNSDIFCFINFSTSSTNPRDNEADVNFFTLPNLSDFDGVILLANSFNCAQELNYLLAQIKSTNIPALSVEYELQGIPKIVTDNYSGMYDLSEHLLTVHNVKEILFIGGPKTHPECQTRLRALMDAAYKHNNPIPADNIRYGDWGKICIPPIITEWFEKHDSLPDAIICANDIMAVATAEHLRELGYIVPNDVIITGYDCINQAQEYYSPITSVNHSWNTMGELALEKINNLINGEKIENTTTLNTKLVIGESCGCKSSRMAHHHTNTLKRALPNKCMDPILADSHYRHFYRAVRKTTTCEDLHHSLSYLIQAEHTIEGNDFALYLDPEFFNIVDGDTNLHINGHTDKYATIVNLVEGKSTELQTIDKHEAIFGSSERTNDNGYYIYMPIHSENVTYGFVKMNGSLNAANENQFYIWSGHMIQALEVARNNITISDLYKKMQILSVTDPLTGVYNRAGCESISYPMMIDYQKEGGYSVIMLVDVDHMKWINDKEGHANGDLALKLVTNALTTGLPNNYLVSRFGGDEFFVAGKLNSKDENIDAIIGRVNEILKRSITENKITFNLTISIGYAVISPKDISEIEKGIIAADQNMYQIKKEHHENL